MRIAAMLLSVGLLLTPGTPVAAQGDTTSVEIGTLLGVTILTQSGMSITQIGIPGDGIYAQPTVYASIFSGRHLMLEPQVAFTSVSSSGRTTTLIGVSGQVGYLVTREQRNSPYVALSVSHQSVSTAYFSSGTTGFGGSVGYRFRVGAGAALRLDVRYRHWSGDFAGQNEVGVGMGLGGIL